MHQNQWKTCLEARKFYACLGTNQARVNTSGCMDALIAKFGWLVAEQQEGNIHHEVTFTVVDALDACVRDQGTCYL